MKRTNPSELLIRQRLSALSRTLPGARKGDAHAVHQARVATRRLREALPLVVPGKSGKTLARKVRRVTRALGPVRELDVALLNLEQLRSSGDVPDTANQHSHTLRLKRMPEALHTASASNCAFAASG